MGDFVSATGRGLLVTEYAVAGIGGGKSDDPFPYGDLMRWVNQQFSEFAIGSHIWNFKSWDGYPPWGPVVNKCGSGGIHGTTFGQNILHRLLLHLQPHHLRHRPRHPQDHHLRRHPEQDSVALEDAARVAKVDGAASQRIIAWAIARDNGAQVT